MTFILQSQQDASIQLAYRDDYQGLTERPQNIQNKTKLSKESVLTNPNRDHLIRKGPMHISSDTITNANRQCFKLL